jgi:hypothetical protein
MDVPRYIDGEGRLLYKGETSKHHIQWRSDWYNTPTERKYRNATGMVLRMSNHHHQQLHIEVEPPVKPNQNLMQMIYREARNMEWSDQYDHFIQIARFVGNVALSEGNARNVEDANLLFDNLLQQSVFIDLGAVRIVRGV